MPDGWWGGVNQHGHTGPDDGGTIPYEKIVGKNLVQTSNPNTIAQTTLGLITIPASVFALATRIDYEAVLTWLQQTGVAANDPTLTLLRDGAAQLSHVGNAVAFASSATVRLIRFNVTFTLVSNGVFDYVGEYWFMDQQVSTGVAPTISRVVGFTNRAGFNQGADHTIAIAATNPIANANYSVTHRNSIVRAS